MDGKRSVFLQPDGTAIQLAFYGNEMYTRTETEDGYTVVFDPETKAYYYAELNAQGDAFRSSGHRVGPVIPKKNALPKGLKLNPAARKAKALARYEQLEAVRQEIPRRTQIRQQVKAYKAYQKLLREKPPTKSAKALSASAAFAPGPIAGGGPGPIALGPPNNPPTLGDLVGLTILVDFSDEPARTDITTGDIDDYLNKPGGNWSNSGSVYDYFYVQSNGRLRYNNNVTYYVRVPQPKSYYNDTSLSSGIAGRLLLNDAVTQLLTDGYDFSGLSTDGSGRVIACNIFWAGNDSGVWAKGLWPHRWVVSPQIDIGGGMKIYDYQATNIGASGTPKIGTFCHENGHMVGKYSDYYDYGGESRGVHAFCLMSAGNYYSQGNPANISGYLKYHSGWMDAVELRDLTPPIRLSADVDGTIAYIYSNTNATDEYFFIENRSKVGGWEAGGNRPDSGLMISHIDESENGTEDEQMTEANHYEHSVEQADGLFELENNTGNADNNDLYHAGGTGPNTEFSDTTSPNAKWWEGADGSAASGTDSGLHIHSVSAAGSTMTFIYGTGTPAGAPATSLSRDLLENATDYGGTAPAQTFAVLNSGGGTLTYGVSDDVAWLACAPTNGTSTGESDTISVEYTTSGLSAGTYNGTITVNGGVGGTNTIAVTLTVNVQPVLQVDPTSLLSVGLSSQPGPQVSFDLENIGGGVASYTVSNTNTFLTLDPSAGTVGLERDTINVNLSATNLAAGVYSDTITVTSPEASNSPLSIPVTYTVQSVDLLLTYPNGGEAFQQGDDIDITWTSTLGGTVKIDVLKGGVFEAEIVAATANDGTNRWNIPLTLAADSDYAIRITSIENGSYVDEGNATFTIAALSGSCVSFESDFDGWQQDTGDDFDWSRHSGSTISGNTGPSGASDGTYYLYTESSSPNYPSKTATVYKDFNFATLDSPQFSFDYHMYGGSMGTLSLEASTNGGSTFDNPAAWSLSGDQGDVWNTQIVDLSAYAGNASVRLRFRGVTSTSFTSDFSIDNVCVTDVVSNGVRFANSVTYIEEPDGAATISVQRFGIASGAASVNVATSNGSADASDYTSTSTNLSWANGESGVKTISVPITDDILGEPVETVTLTLSSPVGEAIVGANPASLNIISEDVTPDLTVAIAAASVSEGDGAAATTATVTRLGTNGALLVSLSSSDTGKITVPASTTIADGQTSSPAFNLDAVDDALADGTATIMMTASAVGYADGADTIDVTDDDVAALSVNIASASMSENGGSSAATVTRNTPTAGALIVNLSSDDTSEATVPAQVTILAGQTVAPFTVTAVDDALTDGTQTATISASAPGNAGVVATTDFTGRTVSGATASTITWTVGGISDPGDLTTTAPNGLFDTANAQGHFAPDRNVDTEGPWSVTLPLALTVGELSLDNVVLDYQHFSNSGTYQSATRTVNWTVAVTGSVSGVLASVAVPGVSSLSGTATATLSPSLVLTNTETFYMTITAVGTTAGNNTGLDALTINGTIPGHADGADTIDVLDDDLAYTVAFDGNGNTGGTPPADQTKISNVDLTLAGAGTLLRSGHTFSGWNTATNGSGTAYAAGGTYSANAAATLYAQWTLNTYTVSYDDNGSTGGSAPADQTKTHDVDLTLAGAGTLVRTGYSFSGWNTVTNGSGTAYAAGATYAPNAAVALYAQWAPDTYTVTYAGNGNTAGTPPADQTKTHDLDLTLAAAGTLVREDHTFSGWNTAPNGSGTAYPTSGTYTLNVGDTLYAQWTLNTYTISYDGNDNTAGTPPADQTKTHDVDLTLASTGTLVRTGHTFNGWNTATNGTGTAYAAAGTYTTNVAATLYAQWTADTYTISYDGNGNTGGVPPADQTKTYDVNLSLAGTGTLVRTGHSFSGWNTATNGAGTAYAAAGIYTTNVAATLFAQWTPDTYALSYDGNGNTGGAPPANQAKSHDLDLTLAGAATLVRSGHSFSGWNTATNGAGTAYAAGGTYSTNAAVTLFARWTPATYTISYDGNGNTAGVATADQTKTHDVDLTLASTGTLVRVGYSFNGWNTLTNGSGTAYAAGGMYVTNVAATLFAHWTPDTYTVSYDGNGNTGGTVPTAQIKTHDADLTLAGDGDLVKLGYTFSGWNTATNGAGTAYAAGGTYSTDADATFYSRWISTNIVFLPQTTLFKFK
jgi:M6 family metalloprotease-like protein